MNKQEIKKAIDILEIRQQFFEEHSDMYQSVKVVLEILRKQLSNGWIPCIKEYPEEGKRVIVWDSLNSRVAIAYFSCPHWEADDGRVNAIAWQPLPEPYKEISE